MKATIFLTIILALFLFGFSGCYTQYRTIDTHTRVTETEMVVNEETNDTTYQTTVWDYNMPYSQVQYNAAYGFGWAWPYQSRYYLGWYDLYYPPHYYDSYFYIGWNYWPYYNYHYYPYSNHHSYGYHPYSSYNYNYGVQNYRTPVYRNFGSSRSYIGRSNTPSVRITPRRDYNIQRRDTYSIQRGQSQRLYSTPNRESRPMYSAPNRESRPMYSAPRGQSQRPSYSPPYSRIDPSPRQSAPPAKYNGGTSNRGGKQR
jgi:hypothetical protein